MASSVDARRRIKNAPLRVGFVILNVSTLLPLSGGLTGMDAEISCDFAAFADLAAAETEIGTTGYGYVDFAATETAYDNVVLQVKASNGSAVTYRETIEFEPCLDSGVVQSGSSTSVVLRSAASATNDIYNGAVFEVVRGTGAGQIRTIVDYVGASVTATLDRALVTALDNTSVYIIHPRIGNYQGTDIVSKANSIQLNSDATAAANLALLYTGGLNSGTVNDAAATTTVFIGDSGLSSSDDFYNGCLLVFTSGTNKGIAEKVSDYTGSTRTFTMANAFPNAPANSTPFVILGKVR